MTKNRNSVMLFIFILAILLAVVVFLAFSIMRNRGGAEAGLEAAPANPVANLVTVGTEAIALQVDPALRVQIVSVVSEPPPIDQVQPGSEPPLETPVIVDSGQPTAVPAQPTAAGGEPLPAQPVVIAPAGEKVIFTPLTVQAGDTLYSIARRSDTSIALMAAHGIAADKLIAGQTINIPVGNPAYCANNGRPYVVREGDTAYSVAVRFNTTHQQLQLMNNLDAAFTINVSDVICVP